jgi:hypothetical protein
MVATLIYETLMIRHKALSEFVMHQLKQRTLDID